MGPSSPHERAYFDPWSGRCHGNSYRGESLYDFVHCSSPSDNLTTMSHFEKVLVHRCSFSRAARQSMLVTVRTSQATWARGGFFGISTVATSEHLPNTHYTKPSKENELILYIWIPHISILFPAQAQVISACAELAKRLVSGQSLACEDDKGSTHSSSSGT